DVRGERRIEPAQYPETSLSLARDTEAAVDTERYEPRSRLPVAGEDDLFTSLGAFDQFRKPRLRLGYVDDHRSRATHTPAIAILTILVNYDRVEQHVDLRAAGASSTAGATRRCRPGAARNA